MSSGPTVVAIDGPAGVGKSTAARLLAKRLGVPYLDTGAMYRCLTLRALRDRVPLDSADAVERSARQARLDLEWKDGAVRLALDGATVGDEIRSAAVSHAVSRVSSYPGVRARMVELQRRFGRRYGGVIEGRDIGSVVFPETPFKFFLDADPSVRAERRYQELVASGEPLERRDVAAELVARDRQDRERANAPLVETPGHHRIDTTDLVVDEVVEEMLRTVEQRACTS